MREKIKPIQRSLIVGCVLFLLLLCILLTAQSYLQFSVALYGQSQQRLENVIEYVESQLDKDDLRVCINTRTTSEKYDQLQQLLNGMVDTFDLSYIYISIPSGNVMVNVVSSTSRAEREQGLEDMPFLEPETGYPSEVMALYQKAWKSGTMTFFREASEYGTCFTGCQCLKAPDGSTFALLCADVYTDDLRRTVRIYALVSAAITVVLGLCFGALLLHWLRRDVTGPVLALAKSARLVSEKSHDIGDLRRLRFEKPELRNWNEVASLADAVATMTEQIKQYVETGYSAEVRAKSAQIEAEDMSRIAYQDALTHVKNRTAYNVKEKELEEEIRKFRTDFAIVMVDVNFLKRVNDTYGHDYGDKYLIGACAIICDVFKHSPVYRVGGDEFLAVLQGQDYEHRDDLMVQLKERFKGSDDESLQPWENFSAACGIGVCQLGDSVEQVLKNAEEEMYRHKAEMKGGRI